MIDESLRILNISNINIWDLGYGKGRLSTYLPLRGFVDRGHKVWFLTSGKNTYEDTQKLKAEGINISTFRIPVPNTRKPFSYFFAILYRILYFISAFALGYRIAHKVSPDLIYGHTVYDVLPAFIISKIFGIPYILRLYGVFSPPFGKLRRIFSLKNLDLLLAFKIPADAYILTNDGTSADKIALSFGVPKEKISFLVNGINKNLPKKSDSYVLKTVLSPNGEKIVLSISRLVDWKQIDLLIKAIPEVVKNQPNTIFVIVGDGPEKENLINLCDNFGVSDFVRFEGSVANSEIAKYMLSADIFVSPNSLSSISNPVIEAMCCGKCVIVLNNGTTAELIKHNENGILINLEETEKLPYYILNLLTDDDLRQRIGKNAQEFILKNWPDWDERVKIEVDLAEKLVESHHKA